MSNRDRLAGWLLAICLLVTGLLVSFVVSGAHPSAAGSVHPEYATMLVGGDGLERTQGFLVRGWAYGVLAIAFFAISFAVAVSRPGFGLGPLRLWFWLATASFLMAWTAFMLSYARFVEAPAQVDFLFGFPLPTALMLYVLWPLPMLYMAIYLYFFRSFVWTAADEALLENLRSQERAES